MNVHGYCNGVFEQETLPEHGTEYVLAIHFDLEVPTYLSSSKRNLKLNRQRHFFRPSDLSYIRGYKSTAEYSSCRTDHTRRNLPFLNQL